MNIKKLAQHAEIAHQAIFNNWTHCEMPTGADIPVLWTPKHTVRKVELTRFKWFPWVIQKDNQDMEIMVRRVTFLEQNPARRTTYGAMARDGHQITWVLFNDEYTGMGVVNGRFFRNIHAAVRDMQQGSYAR
jgi:hypothetical protein